MKKIEYSRKVARRCKECGGVVLPRKGRGRPKECCGPTCLRVYKLEYHKLYDSSGHGKAMRQKRKERMDDKH